jgi:3-oxoadipate enol-lactonase
MWQPQVTALAGTYRLVRYDHRGHGRSAVPPGPYEIGDLGRDVLELLDRLGIARAHYVGTSLGGMVGLWLAVHAPERIDRLALVCSAAYLPPASAWLERAAAVRAGRMAEIAGPVVGRWFTPQFAAAEPETVAAARDALLNTPPEGYAGCCAAIAGMDQRADLPSITAPTLVISADRDQSIPPERGRVIADAVPGARFALVAGAHLASIENPAAVTPLLAHHLGG